MASRTEQLVARLIVESRRWPTADAALVRRVARVVCRGNPHAESVASRTVDIMDLAVAGHLQPSVLDDDLAPARAKK